MRESKQSKISTINPPLQFVMLKSLKVLSLVLPLAHGHGHMTLPASTRNGGELSLGNNCTNQACLWFSNNVQIPGEPTLPSSLRSIQQNVTTLPQDVFATSPWRSPGSAPVFGSGCGLAGGDVDIYLNGGSIKGFKQGMDGVDLPQHGTPEIWKRGDTAEVAFAIAANHGGGYSYRLCPSDGNVNEACFQRTQLDFAGKTSDVLWPNGTRLSFPRVTTSKGTYPKNSEWARNPIPGCYLCDAYETCGAPLAPVSGTCAIKNACTSVKSQDECTATATPEGGTCKWYGPKAVCYDPQRKKPTKNCPARVWDNQVNCYGQCDGTASLEKDGSCSEGTANFPAPAPAISGFGKRGWSWSIADRVQVPSNLKPGKYLLSWRWDCEESTQVWENCADIVVE